MALFETIINNELFKQTCMILFLTKKDLFIEKIKRTPLKICFPEYEGANDFKEASEYIWKQFECLNKTPSTKYVYVHFTCNVDSQNIKVSDAMTYVFYVFLAKTIRLIFFNILNSILNNKMSES